MTFESWHKYGIRNLANLVYRHLFLYSSQQTGYISKGVSAIVKQSNESATLQMIATRDILSQCTMIGHNRHQNRHIETIIIERLKMRKANCPIGNRTRDLALHKREIWCSTWRTTLLASFFWLFRRPGVEAE